MRGRPRCMKKGDWVRVCGEKEKEKEKVSKVDVKLQAWTPRECAARNSEIVLDSLYGQVANLSLSRKPIGHFELGSIPLKARLLAQIKT